jgi:lysophospholipase L1-like esterase
MGFGQALKIGIDVTRPPHPPVLDREVSAPLPPVAEGHLLVLGDSLARGTGDATGQGYAGRTVEILAMERGEEIELINLAVEGMRSDELVDQLQDPGVLAQIEGARWILVSIGGNDLRDVERVPVPEQEDLYSEQKGAYLENLSTSIDRIRSVNPSAPLLLLGLYNPDSEASSETVLKLHDWNHGTQLLIEGFEAVFLVPSYDLFERHLDSYLFIDRLHPNDAGHQAIADRMADVLLPIEE